ncbi:uncharacterized protein M421DRAFT_53085 [Didymella exigua CBS 183.55]|uniref:Uncharacterized protein n=1 Tax=Didymella exigua CBS 183.55 TaxID=1150837 RepID=A0A6A5S207_9PLEO|nr:uncharacterized protein M421DRAFT_53085 [Didymella exigua CBS 183.55]KAF1932536.1 hypothetical protein M421DRAFT_53085 [Didymella exigua CBS 183.55]
MSQKAPYPPKVWALGGKSDKSIDIPVTAICLALYICGAAMHMTILQLNQRRDHKFLFNGVLFGFCMSRIVTCSLRISSIVYSHNIRLAIAAQIFTAAGVLLIFIVNLLWTQRLVRSLHPHFGWHAIPSTILKMLWPIIALTLAALITATVQSFYTLRPRTHFIDRAVQLYGVTFLAVISFLPLPILAIAFAVPRKRSHDKFGAGRLRIKVAVLVAGTILVCFGASYRAGTSWLTPVPMTQPLPAYYHKAAFYFVDFGVEIATVFLYAIMRVDLRFHVPDGASGPGSYSSSERLGGKAEA